MPIQYPQHLQADCDCWIPLHFQFIRESSCHSMLYILSYWQLAKRNRSKTHWMLVPVYARSAAVRMRDRGFESHRGNGCMFVMSVMSCQVEFSAASWAAAPSKKKTKKKKTHTHTHIGYESSPHWMDGCHVNFWGGSNVNSRTFQGTLLKHTCRIKSDAYRGN
jgi:hypothetical protein